LRTIGADFTGKQILKCDDCQYVMTPVSTDGETSEIYDNPEYFDGWGCNLEFDYDRFEPAVHAQVREYLEFIKRHAHGKSLLDVGTGSGLLPHMARGEGYDVEGTDLSRHVSETLPEKAGFRIHQGALEEIAFDRNYDVVTMLHVLEHTADPLSTMKRAREILNDDGIIIVVVPNYQSLDTRIKDLLSRFKLKGRPYKHLALGHHNYVFSVKSLERLGQKAGLSVVQGFTRQPAWRASKWHSLLARFQYGAWCWMVYKVA
jgi:2-polyprenyl-3-methyl-5-hydroxy-6-metoxy-1,4-benzoquinol methylase